MTRRGGGHPGVCGLCGSRLKRNGTTSAGTTRWRCTSCGASSTKQRQDLSRRAELNAFLGWLLGPSPQTKATSSSARTFRRKTAWCWLVEPTITVTGEIYDEIQIDGIYLSSKWCCLIASNHHGVIAWQWCDREKTAAWKALLEQVPPPTVVVCDGGSGLLPAIAEAWPDTRVQRCLVHVQRNIRTYLTTKPRTDAGKALWGLARSLTNVTTHDEAVAWLQHLNEWHAVYGHLTRERTYLNHVRNGAVPAWIRPGQRWWYTHDRLRRAYRLLTKLAQHEQLFTYLAPEHEGLAISSTTNRIEGGINAGLRELLLRHRGMSEHHQRRAIEWWLHAHAITAPSPTNLIPTHLARPAVRTNDDNPQAEPLGPAAYDTGLTAEEGLWTRRGWAGRT